MKREARLLLGKAYDSLTLCVEVFNRPYDCGRMTTSLILAGHALEMLLKAAIVERNGKIREKDEKDTIGFDKCVDKCFSDGQIRFLTEEQKLTLHGINGMRDAAQHYLLEVSEELLYVSIQTSVTLFGDLVESVFHQHLRDVLPLRVLPLSTTPPTNIDVLFDREIATVSALLAEGRRRRIEAKMRLRPLLIMDKALCGETHQPTDAELAGSIKGIQAGTCWRDLFPGVASMDMSSSGTGPSFALRLVKKEGTPVVIVPAGTPGITTVAVKRVNEMDYYSLSRDALAAKVGLSGSKTTAIIWYARIKENSEYSKLFKMGAAQFWRYSSKAIDEITRVLSTTTVDFLWQAYCRRNSNSPPAAREQSAASPPEA